MEQVCCCWPCRSSTRTRTPVSVPPQARRWSGAGRGCATETAGN
uniref:Uncharacterized protein n=1 Tax=Mycolicibacterium phage phi1_186018 TaxID=3236641 RepID=A0AB39AKK3_9CAUD